MAKGKKVGKWKLAAGIALASVVLWAATAGAPEASETYLRSRAVKLISSQGSCSGEQVRAPSGVDYILSAGHCRILEDKAGNIKVVLGDGKELLRRVIAEDAHSDLLLIEGLPGMEGLPIAKRLSATQHIRTFTNGGGMATYKTEGTVIQDQVIQILAGAIMDEASLEACQSQAKYKVMDLVFIKACVMETEQTMTTAMIIPGSSGGMAVDDDGALVGVASATDGKMGIFVRLVDIQRFLGSY